MIFLINGLVSIIKNYGRQSSPELRPTRKVSWAITTWRELFDTTRFSIFWEHILFFTEYAFYLIYEVSLLRRHNAVIEAER
jgi:hypothetical protein